MQVKNCVIYTRVLTDTQAEKEFSSCEAQEEKIRTFSKSQMIRKFLKNLKKNIQSEPYIENFCFRLNHNPDDSVRNKNLAPQTQHSAKIHSLLFFICSHNENKGKLCSFKKLQKRKFMVSCKKVFSQRSCLCGQ